VIFAYRRRFRLFAISSIVAHAVYRFDCSARLALSLSIPTVYVVSCVCPFSQLQQLMDTVDPASGDAELAESATAAAAASSSSSSRAAGSLFSMLSSATLSLDIDVDDQLSTALSDVLNAPPRPRGDAGKAAAVDSNLAPVDPPPSLADGSSIDAASPSSSSAASSLSSSEDSAVPSASAAASVSSSSSPSSSMANDFLDMQTMARALAAERAATAAAAADATRLAARVRDVIEEKHELLTAFKRHVEQLTDERARVDAELIEARAALAASHARVGEMTAAHEQRMRVAAQEREATAVRLRAAAAALATSESERRSWEAHAGKLQADWAVERQGLADSIATLLGENAALRASIQTQAPASLFVPPAMPVLASSSSSSSSVSETDARALQHERMRAHTLQTDLLERDRQVADLSERLRQSEERCAALEGEHRRATQQLRATNLTLAQAASGSSQSQQSQSLAPLIPRASLAPSTPRSSTPSSSSSSAAMRNVLHSAASNMMQPVVMQRDRAAAGSGGSGGSADAMITIALTPLKVLPPQPQPLQTSSPSRATDQVAVSLFPENGLDNATAATAAAAAAAAVAKPSASGKRSGVFGAVLSYLFPTWFVPQTASLAQRATTLEGAPI
jgi:hypothetical protein